MTTNTKAEFIEDQSIEAVELQAHWDFTPVLK